MPLLGVNIDHVATIRNARGTPWPDPLRAAQLGFSIADVLASVHREGEVVSTFHEDGGVRVRARLADASAGRLSEFVVHSA